MKNKNAYHVYAIITIVFWSLAYVLTRLSLQYFTSYSLGFLRYLIASGTLTVIVIAGRIKVPQKQDLGLFILSGASGFFLYMVLFNQGQSMVTAATGSVVIATVPVITALLAYVIDKEYLQTSQWVAIIIAFIGVVVLTLLGGNSFSFNRGLAWLLPAAVALSTYNMIQRRLTKRYTAVQASAYSIFFGTIMLAVFAPRAFGELAAAPPIQVVYLLVLGVFSSAAAYVCWSKAFAGAPKASSVSNYMFITPFVTSILGFLLADEVPDRATLGGGAIILLGVCIFNFGRSK